MKRYAVVTNFLGTAIEEFTEVHDRRLKHNIYELSDLEAARIEIAIATYNNALNKIHELRCTRRRSEQDED